MRVPLTMGVLLALLGLPGVAHPGIQTFTTADGLAQDGVRVSMEDRDGALWFGTFLGGLSRFDGESWATFDSTGADLPGNGVFDLHEDPAGDVWVATNEGVARYDGASWQTFAVTVGLPSAQITQIVRDSSANLWFRGAGAVGVARYDGASWTRFTTADGLVNDTVNDVLVDAGGAIWFATDGGVSRFDGTTWNSFTTAVGLAGNVVETLLADAAGDLWFGTTSGLSRYDGAVWTTFTTADNLPANSIQALFEEALGAIWAGTFAGASRWNGSAWQRFTTLEGLADNNVTRIEQDARGFVWFGSPVSQFGVSRWDGAAFDAFTTLNGMSANNATQIMRTSDDNVWITTATAGVNRFDGVTFRSFRSTDGLAGDAVQALDVDSTGALWAGTAFGASRFDGASWQTFTTADGLPSDNVRAVLALAGGPLWLGTDGGAVSYDGFTWTPVTFFNDRVNAVFRDSRGDMWFGTRNSGLYRRSGAVWTQWTTPQLRSNEVLSVSEDAQGNMWVGTKTGANRYDGATWFDFTTVQGLPNNQINDVHGTAGGLVWFATENGIARYDGVQVVTFAETDGLASRSVFSIFEDPFGILWFGTLSGVSRFNGLRFVTFQEGDGLAGPRVQDITRDPKDRYWFGIIGGLTRHEPDRVPPRAVVSPAPPPLSANRLQTIPFVAAWNESRGIVFSHSFDGEPFSPWSPVGFFQRSGVADGMHTFDVRAMDEFGNVQQAATRVTFEIDATPPEPDITSPRSGGAVSGTVEVLGTTADARFAGSVVQVRPFGSMSWDSPPAIVLKVSAVPVVAGTLAVWPTAGWPEGDYDLRVVVADTLGLFGAPTPLRITVDNAFPFAGQTSPVRVVAGPGGEVYTTNAEVRAFFPPNAFNQDAVVTISGLPDAAAPDSLAPGVRRLSQAFDVNWVGAQLQKTCTMEIDYSSTAIPPGLTKAVYAAGTDSVWLRIGGTDDAQTSTIALPFTGPGRFAVFTEIAAPSGAGMVSALSLSPRVFSPRGNFSDTRIAIGFSLGRSGPVNVKIYNRAGRLVREVMSAGVLSAGANLVYWDGRDRDGDLAGEGLYLVSVEAFDEKRTQTLAVVK